MSNLLLFLYLLVSAFHLWFCYKDCNTERLLTKPFLMPVLLLYFIVASSSPSIIVILAILFGFIGDTFLLSDDSQSLFIAGLLTFLLGHICYIIALANEISIKPSITIIFAIILILGILGALAYSSLFRHLNKMKLPVLSYLIIICTMVFYAALFFITENTSSSTFALIGSICFIVSDYILARTSFIERFKLHKLYIMSTYLAAQFLLVISFIN